MAKQADLVKRIIAAVADLVILAVVGFVIMAIFGAPLAFVSMASDPLQAAAIASTMMAASLISLLISLAYFVYFEGTTGQTLGKKIVNIKVVMLKSGRQLEYADALVRNILRIIDFLPMFYILGLILIAASENKQRLGDMAAKTIVVEA
jgi:uncharacterized RDD family membrane protein YckC